MFLGKRCGPWASCFCFHVNFAISLFLTTCSETVSIFCVCLYISAYLLHLCFVSVQYHISCFFRVYPISALFAMSPESRRINQRKFDTKFCLYNAFLTFPYAYPLDGMTYIAWRRNNWVEVYRVIKPSNDKVCMYVFLREDFDRVCIRTFSKFDLLLSTTPWNRN
jgi:hypothetical protein